MCHTGMYAIISLFVLFATNSVSLGDRLPGWKQTSACYGAQQTCSSYKIRCAENQTIVLGSMKYGIKPSGGNCLFGVSNCAWKNQTDCCIPKAGDRMTPFTATDRGYAYGNCSGIRFCTQKAPRINDHGVSSYITIDYKCVPDNDVIKLCTATNLARRVLYLTFDVINDYVFPTIKGSRDCKCGIYASNPNASIQLTYVNVRFNRPHSHRCSSAVLRDSTGMGVIQCDPATGEAPVPHTTLTHPSPYSLTLTGLYGDGSKGDRPEYLMMRVEADDPTSSVGISCQGPGVVQGGPATSRPRLVTTRQHVPSRPDTSPSHATNSHSKSSQTTKSPTPKPATSSSALSWVSATGRIGQQRTSSLSPIRTRPTTAPAVKSSGMSTVSGGMSATKPTPKAQGKLSSTAGHVFSTQKSPSSNSAHSSSAQGHGSTTSAQANHRSPNPTAGQSSRRPSAGVTVASPSSTSGNGASRRTSSNPGSVVSQSHTTVDKHSGISTSTQSSIAKQTATTDTAAVSKTTNKETSARQLSSVSPGFVSAKTQTTQDQLQFTVTSDTNTSLGRTTPSPDIPTLDGGDDAGNKNLVIGLAVGLTLLLIVIATIVVCVCIRYKRKDKNHTPSNFYNNTNIFYSFPEDQANDESIKSEFVDSFTREPGEIIADSGEIIVENPAYQAADENQPSDSNDSPAVNTNGISLYPKLYIDIPETNGAVVGMETSTDRSDSSGGTDATRADNSTRPRVTFDDSALYSRVDKEGRTKF